MHLWRRRRRPVRRHTDPALPPAQDSEQEVTTSAVSTISATDRPAGAVIAPVSDGNCPPDRGGWGGSGRCNFAIWSGSLNRETGRLTNGPVRRDDHGVIAVDGIDQGQPFVPGHRHGSGQRIGQTEIGPTDTGRRRPGRRQPGVGIDEVGTPLVCARCGQRMAPATTHRSSLVANGLTMPKRNGSEGPSPPKLAMSPAALTMAPVMAGSRSAASARCAAQPFTYPVGSTPPGRAQGSNHPPESSRAVEQRSRTSATSGGAIDDGDLATTEPADGAVRLPRAEHGIGVTERCTGPLEQQSGSGGRQRSRSVEIDGHDGAHDLEVMDDVSGAVPYRRCR